MLDKGEFGECEGRLDDLIKKYQMQLENIRASRELGKESNRSDLSDFGNLSVDRSGVEGRIILSGGNFNVLGEKEVTKSMLGDIGKCVNNSWKVRLKVNVELGLEVDLEI